jgi:hypothetical protein
MNEQTLRVTKLDDNRLIIFTEESTNEVCKDRGWRHVIYDTEMKGFTAHGAHTFEAFEAVNDSINRRKYSAQIRLLADYLLIKPTEIKATSEPSEFKVFNQVAEIVHRSSVEADMIGCYKDLNLTYCFRWM